MKKEGFQGWSILVGAVVGIISYLIGPKFFFFLLVGIALFFYGVVKLFILKDKAHERITKDEHHTRASVHRARYPLLPVKACQSCAMLLPQKANYCMHCGAKA